MHVRHALVKHMHIDSILCVRFHKDTGEKQVLVSDINRKLKSVRPKHAFAILGITWVDLYPTEDLNFVLGELFGLK